MKHLIFLAAALFIDFLQAMLMLFFIALQVATPVGGGIGAAGMCGYLGGSAWQTIKCAVVGAGASVFAVPLGMAVDFLISLTLGSALIIALAWFGAFSPGAVLAAFVGESIPVLNVFPGWTLMTWRCLRKLRHQEGGAHGMLGIQLHIPDKKVAPTAARAWALPRIMGLREQRFAATATAVQKSAVRTAPVIHNIQGIRPKPKAYANPA